MGERALRRSRSLEEEVLQAPEQRPPTALGGDHAGAEGMFPEGAAACGEDPRWGSKKLEVEGAVDRNCQELAAKPPFTTPLHCLGQGEDGGVGGEAVPGKKGAGGGGRYFNLSVFLALGTYFSCQ